MTELSNRSSDIHGKVVARATYDYDEGLAIAFTDGTVLYVYGIWHQDSTAGTAVALLRADDPKSYGDSSDFFDVAREREWPRG